MVGGGVSEIAIHELNLKSLLCRKRRTIIRRDVLCCCFEMFTQATSTRRKQKAAALAVMYLGAEVRSSPYRAW